MTVARQIRPKCFFTAWVFGWVTAIYVASALIAVSGLSPLADGRSLPAATFALADEVSPAAKIGFAVMFAGLMFMARRLIGSRGPGAVALDMLLAALATLLVLAFLPSDWSRGFGIGLTGSRFAPDATIIYLGTAFLAGFVFSTTERRCAARGARPGRRAT